MPTRDERHDALAVFLGQWRAEGTSYGESDGPWRSTHVARWHTGEFFLVQDERATTGGRPFDTLSVMGVDPETGRWFARTFENHGFSRHYDVSRDGRVWTFAGAEERARIELSEDGRTQTIHWEWRRDGAWAPLCDRVARRVD